MSNEMMNTREVAEYLGIHEKQVYALIKEKRIPCTRVTGKWLFPKHLIDAWIEDNARDGVTPHEMKGRRGGFILAAGSNDPVLDFLLNRIKGESALRIFSCSTGSTEGLNLLAEGMADIAWCHLFDPASDSFNVPQALSILAGRKFAVVHLFYRESGFISAPGGVNPVSFRDLARQDVRFVNRQKGSGTRIFIDLNLEKEGIAAADVRGYDREVYTHIEVALAILSGDANAGVATVAVSKLFGLAFSPLVRESFDMVLAQDTFFSKEIQAFIDTLRTDEFRKWVRPMGNYDFKESGKILYSN